VILALVLASALTAALVGEEDSPSSPRPLPVDLDPTGAPSVQNYIDPATCDLAFPLALDTAPTRSVLTIRNSTLFFNSCTENILVQNANWYTLTAEDTPAVQATICEEGEGSSAISTDTILFLDVSVGDCEAKMCVPTVIRLKEASCLVFAWLVESGQAYNLAVFEAEGSPRVPFSLMVETTQSLDNLSCTEARAITIGESVSLDTLESDSYEANELELYTNCDGLQTDTPTRWYKVFGRGFGVTARICSRAALAIEVHISSSCRNNTAHQCAKVSARKDDTFCTAYSWASGLESEHRVAIAAAQPEQNGGYSVEFLINDSCENALELPELPFSDSGNTRSIVPSFNTKAFVCLLLGDSFYKGVWYRWTASTEGCVTVSAKGANAVPFEERLDPAIAIYQGDCLTTLECVAMNEDASFFQADSEATFDPQVDTTYFVLVFETGGGSGAFEVEIKVCALQNDSILPTSMWISPLQHARCHFSNRRKPARDHLVRKCVRFVRWAKKFPKNLACISLKLYLPPSCRAIHIACPCSTVAYNNAGVLRQCPYPATRALTARSHLIQTRFYPFRI
jgi:hypothetical protein